MTTTDNAATIARLSAELDAIAAAAWDGYSHHRKAPRTRKAGPGYADPDYYLAVDWLNAKAAIFAVEGVFERLGFRLPVQGLKHSDAAVVPLPIRKTCGFFRGSIEDL